MKKYAAAILIILLFFSVHSVFAESYYQKGSSVFTVKAGITVPLFAKFIDHPTIGTRSLPDDMRTKVGGFGSLTYQVFLNQHFMLGGELGYGFNYSEAKKILTTVPFTAKISYVPVQTGKFDLLLSANLGFSFNKYNKSKRFMPYASLSVTPTFYIGKNWGLALDAGIWFDAELYSGDKKKRNAIVSMAPITFALSYRK